MDGNSLKWGNLLNFRMEVLSFILNIYTYQIGKGYRSNISPDLIKCLSLFVTRRILLRIPHADQYIHPFAFEKTQDLFDTLFIEAAQPASSAPLFFCLKDKVLTGNADIDQTMP